MSAALLDSLLQSPVLPEILQDAQRAWELELRLRKKFYQDITPEHKWEFIQGEVIMQSPAQHRHLMATKRLMNLMDAYTRVKNLGLVHVEKAMTSFPRNDYEPDIMFFGAAKLGSIDPDTLRFPIPDLIVEVLSSSTEKRDRGVKFEDYGLHGVAEYWIVDPIAESVELYRLVVDAYPPVEPLKDGLLSSNIIPGFDVPVRAIFDEAENMQVLREILSGA